MALAIQCESCAGINQHLVANCEYCGSKLDFAASWNEFLGKYSPHLKQLEQTLNNYPAREILFGMLLVFGGPILTGYIAYTMMVSVLWVVMITAVSILPFFLIMGAFVVRAENRMFDNVVRAKLIEFQREHRLEYTDLAKMVKEACGEESILYEQLPKLR